MADYQLLGRDRWLRYSSQGMSGPLQDRSAVRKATVHYNGGNAVITFDIEQYLRVVAGMNDGYWSSRGYALGYNWGLSPGGHLVFIRGLDIRCAANGCQEVNVPATAVQVLTATPTTDMTPQQADALENVWIPWLRVQYQNRLEVHVIGHRDINPLCPNPTGTICPGVKIYPRIQANVFDAPSLTPPPPTGDEDMALIIGTKDGTTTQKGHRFAWNGVNISYLGDETQIDTGIRGGILRGNSADPGKAFRDLTVAEIQKMINEQWSGAPGFSLPGFTVPNHFKPGTDAANTAAKNAADTLTSVGPDLKKQVTDGFVTTNQNIDDVPPGGGATLTQIEAALGRQKVKIVTVPGDADVDVTPAAP